MRVLVADKLPGQALARLEDGGFDLRIEPGLGPADLPQALADVDVLIVRSTQVDAAAIDAASRLRLIVRAGAGTSNIDVPHASARAIFVANCPGKNAIAVAELAIGLLLSLDRRIPAAHAELAAGRWNKKEYGRAAGLAGRTLGIIGIGAIGTATASRARALGMQVVGWSRTFTPERAAELGVGYAATLPELARRSDAISIHLPLTSATRGIVDASVLAALPDGALVVNVSRGGVVDEEAMLRELDAGRLRYGTDVFADEPGASVAPFATALARHPLSVCTPHIGASTDQAERAVADEAVRILLDFRARGVVHHCVNLCEPAGGWLLTVRHYNRVGVLATVLGLIRDAHINVEELENILFNGEVAACAQIQLSGAPSDDVLGAIRACPDVIGVALRELAPAG